MAVLPLFTTFLILFVSAYAEDETTTISPPQNVTQTFSAFIPLKHESRSDADNHIVDDIAKWKDALKRKIEKEVQRENFEKIYRDKIRAEYAAEEEKQKQQQQQKDLVAIPVSSAAMVPAVPAPKSNFGTQGNGIQYSNSGFGLFGQQPLDAGSMLSSGMVQGMLNPPRNMGDASATLIPSLVSPTMQQGINQQQSALGTNAAFPQYAQQAHPQFVQQPYNGVGSYNQMPANNMMGSMPMPVTSNNGQLMPGFAPSGNQMGFPAQQGTVYNPPMGAMQPQPMAAGNGMVMNPMGQMNTGYGNTFIPNTPQQYPGFGR